MSTSKKEEPLLGKKREKIPNESEEDSSKDPKNKKQKKNSESSDSSDSESSESDKNQPKKSLFGENEKGFTGGLFGDLNNPENNQKSLFGNTGGSLFGNITSGGSLFGNIKNEDQKKEGGLFSGNLFDFSKINKKEEEDEEEGDDNIGKSNSPKHEYNPEKEKESENGNKKKYVKKMNDVYLLDKKEKKFISRGEGFLSIEIQEIEKDGKKERFAILIYRNTIGGIIFEGLLDSKVNKFDSYEKKLKKVCHIFFLMKDDKNVPSLAQAKIPFTSEEDVKEFGDKYKNAIKYLKNEIEDF